MIDASFVDLEQSPDLRSRVPSILSALRRRSAWRRCGDRTALLKFVEIYSVLVAIIDVATIVPPRLSAVITN